MVIVFYFVMSLKSKIENLQENILLANHTTFRIGGPAKYFVAVKSQKEFLAVIRAAKESGAPFYILGGGSNTLAADEGFEGLIIRCQIPNFQCQIDGEKMKIACDAGVPLAKIIIETTKASYSGAEWGFGIPGTVAGAIFGNAGRLGQDISQVVRRVKILDENLDEKTLEFEECGFSYRQSFFKKTGAIILEAELEFMKKEQSAVGEVLAKAKDVVLHSPPFPSAGCVFKNYEVGVGESAAGAFRFRPPTPALRLAPDLRPLNSEAEANQGSPRRPSLNAPAADSLLFGHPELAPRVRGGKIGVGHLIDQCGLKGRQTGGAKIWDSHANYIVNLGGAKAADVLALIKLCKETVKEKYNIELEEEIRHLGI